MVKASSGESVVSRVVRIVECFSLDTPALRVSEIARRADLHVATASRLIDELTRHGWLERAPDRRVLVGVRLWELASRASPTLSLREAAMPFLEDLHAVAGHHVQLGVRESVEVLFVERLSAPGAVVNVTRIAGRLPLHASSSGLILLAHAPDDVRERVLNGPLRAYTARTVVDRNRLRSILAEARHTDSVSCHGYIDERASSIAVPVRGPDATVLASISIVLPRGQDIQSLRPALHAAARGISRSLGG